jgi:VWFA-related protein
VVETNLTTILMTATDKRGRLLNTLKPEDVRIFEDGVPQTLGVFERETERPLSLALLFDVSVSQMRTLPAQKAAARLFLRSVFRPGVDRATVISFAGNAILQQPFTSDLAPLEAAVESVGIASRPTGGAGTQTNASPILPFGGTAIYDALFLTCFKVLTKAAPNTRRAVILLSDGMDNESRLLPRDAVNGAAYANATIYGIGIGTYTVDEQALRYVSEESGGRAFFPTDESDLRAAFAQIERELRSQYLIAYTPTNKAHDGMRRNVRIEITNPLLVKDKVKLAYRSYYYVKKSAKAL